MPPILNMLGSILSGLGHPLAKTVSPRSEQSLSLASTIGTWVAVVVTLAGLGSIIAQIYIYHERRTDRYKALEELTANGADSGGFIIPRSQFPFLISGFRIAAPELSKSPPILPLKGLSWNPDATLVSRSEAVGWIQFACILKAYRPTIDIHYGDPLVIQKREAWLPVSKTWLLLIGILGRFGDRPDLGRLLTAASSLEIETPSSQKLISDSRLPKKMRWSRLSRRSLRPTAPCGECADTILYTDLSGLFGILFFRNDSKAVSGHRERTYYLAHDKSESGDPTSESLTPRELFWLAMGGIPSQDGRVYSIFDPDTHTPIPETHQECDAVSSESEGSGSTSSPSEEDECSHARKRAQFSGKNIERQAQKNSVLHSPVGPYAFSPSHGVKRLEGQLEFNAPRFFEFKTATKREESFRSLAVSMNAERPQEQKVFALEEVSLDDDHEFNIISRQSKSRYMPCNSTWVRLAGYDRDGTMNDTLPLFIKRSDIQGLASAVLQLPITEHGFLFHSGLHSMCKETLFLASHNLHQLMVDLEPEILNIVRNGEKAKRVAAAIKELLPYTRRRYHHVRRTSQLICELDKALDSTLSHLDEDIPPSIGVLMLMSQEFRDIISTAVRHIDDSLNNTMAALEMDRNNGTLTVPSALGSINHFPLDSEAIAPTKPRSTGGSTVPFGYVMLAALRAALRSFALRTAIDSRILLETVLGMESIVHMG